MDAVAEGMKVCGVRKRKTTQEGGRRGSGDHANGGTLRNGGRFAKGDTVV